MTEPLSLSFRGCTSVAEAEARVRRFLSEILQARLRADVVLMQQTQLDEDVIDAWIDARLEAHQDEIEACVALWHQHELGPSHLTH